MECGSAGRSDRLYHFYWDNSYFTGSEESQPVPIRPSDEGRLQISKSTGKNSNFVCRQEMPVYMVIIITSEKALRQAVSAVGCNFDTYVGRTA
jgi:hypothetical protein